jgi:hypothetical protein
MQTREEFWDDLDTEDEDYEENDLANVISIEFQYEDIATPLNVLFRDEQTTVTSVSLNCDGDAMEPTATRIIFDISLTFKELMRYHIDGALDSDI